MKLVWSCLFACLLVNGARAQVYSPYPYTPRIVVQSSSSRVIVTRPQAADPETQPVTYLIAFQGGAIQLAEAYWVRDDVLNYVTTDHRQRTAELASVDRGLSESLNHDRNVEFRLPAPTGRTSLQALGRKLDLILETRETPHGMVVRISDTYFQFNDYHLTAAARVKLARLAGILLAYGGLSPSLHGYTDNVGTNDYNMQLSYRRAEAVREFLISQGVPADRLSAKGSGSSNPVASNSTNEGRRQNRRVEMWISEGAMAGASRPTN